MAASVQESAVVSPKAKLGNDVRIWHHSQVREDVVIGDNSIIGKNVYIDFGVKIGKNCKIQNNVSVYHGAEIQDGVFVGPHVCFTNDMFPRAINPDGSIKGADDWEVSKTMVKKGASLGANSTILPVTIGEFALVAAGSVVTRDVPDYALVMGVPARLAGYVCKCGKKMQGTGQGNSLIFKCSKCRTEIHPGKSEKTMPARK